MQSLNTREKNLWIIFSPMRTGGEIGENFLLAEISGYIVVFPYLQQFQYALPIQCVVQYWFETDIK